MASAALLPPHRDASAAYDQVHDTLQRVLQMYIFHLIDTGAPGWRWLRATQWQLLKREAPLL